MNEDKTRFPGTCRLCNEPVPAEQIIDHLRVVHPGTYGDGPPRWPDGRLAIAVLPQDARHFEESRTMNADDARQWLEAMADDVMSRGGEYGGAIPLSAPDGITAFGTERVVEFHARLNDGTRITTTRPLNPPLTIVPPR